MHKLIDKMSICIYNIKNENIHFLWRYTTMENKFIQLTGKRVGRDILLSVLLSIKNLFVNFRIPVNHQWRH